MLVVMIESPYSGDIDRNVRYLAFVVLTLAYCTMNVLMQVMHL